MKNKDRLGGFDGDWVFDEPDKKLTIREQIVQTLNAGSMTAKICISVRKKSIHTYHILKKHPAPEKSD